MPGQGDAFQAVVRTRPRHWLQPVGVQGVEIRRCRHHIQTLQVVITRCGQGAPDAATALYCQGVTPIKFGTYRVCRRR